VCIEQIDSRILVFDENRLKILWLFDSRIFGARRKINGLVDSRLTGPDIGYAWRSHANKKAKRVRRSLSKARAKTDCSRDEQGCRAEAAGEGGPHHLGLRVAQPRQQKDEACPA
jgi:hypothetical protein